MKSIAAIWVVKPRETLHIPILVFVETLWTPSLAWCNTDYGVIRLSLRFRIVWDQTSTVLNLHKLVPPHWILLLVIALLTSLLLPTSVNFFFNALVDL